MKKSGLSIIAVAIIWAAVLVASAIVLGDTPYWARMLPILGGGAAATIIILGGSGRKDKEP